jgi:PAS domain S-box-containing protein
MIFPEFRPFTGEQIRAARAIARLEQSALAEASGLSLDTIKRIEGIHGPVQVKARVYRAIIEAFQAHGVELECHGESDFGVRRSLGQPASGAPVVAPTVADDPAAASAGPGRFNLALAAPPPPRTQGSHWDDASGPAPRAAFAAPASNMMAYWDRNYRFRFANQDYLSWFGRPMTDLIGRSMPDILGAELFNANETFIRAAMSGEPQTFECTLRKPDKSRRHTLIQYVPDFDLNGEVLGMWVMGTDITVLKDAELKLASANAVFQAARRHADKATTISSETFAGMLRAVKIEVLPPANLNVEPPARAN